MLRKWWPAPLIAIFLLFAGTSFGQEASQTYQLFTYRGCKTVAAVKDVFSQPGEETAAKVFEAYMVGGICARSQFPASAAVEEVLENVTWAEGDSSIVRFRINVDNESQIMYWMVPRKLGDTMRAFFRGV